MVETWWTWEQAVTYVLAHHPCENRRIADGLLSIFVCGDTFPVRWRLHARHGTMVPISGRDWVEDCDIGQGRLAQHLFRTHGNGEVVLEAAAVRRLCEPRHGQAGRDARKGGPDGLRHLIDGAARAVLPNGRPAGMSKKEARTLMSEYIRRVMGRPSPCDRTFQRWGH